jgi:hypothetical protein
MDGAHKPDVHGAGNELFFDARLRLVRADTRYSPAIDRHRKSAIVRAELRRQQGSNTEGID